MLEKVTSLLKRHHSNDDKNGEHSHEYYLMNPSERPEREHDRRRFERRHVGE